MKIDILTLFPDMFDGFKSESIIKRAIDSKKVKINMVNFRNYTKDKHKKVDDTPYGGGSGMVLMCQPIYDCVADLKKKNSKVILLSPQGAKYSQKKAYELSKEKHLILICGHYEGFDERIKDICDEEISIGDYILTGGELPAMILTDSITRLIPGVIDEESHEKESFNGNLLDYPTYTKPRNYKGKKVPEVLLNGDHEKIDTWRMKMQIKTTIEKRPDLILKKAKLHKEGIKENKNKISLDEVKNIKVRTLDTDKKDLKENVSEITKITGYKIVKEEKTIAITVFDYKKLKGYKLKGKENGAFTNKIFIVYPPFIKRIAIKNVLKKLDLLAYRFNLAYQDDDNDEASDIVLGEAEMLRQLVLNTYAKYLGNEDMNMIIKNINFLVSEFVRAKTIKPSIKNGQVTSRRV